MWKLYGSGILVTFQDKTILHQPKGYRTGRATRRWPMYFPIRRNLRARPELDNILWTDTSVLSIESSRWDLLNYMAKHRPILKNNQCLLYPFFLPPKHARTPQNKCFVFVCCYWPDMHLSRETWTHVTNLMHFKWEVNGTHVTQTNTF